MRIRRGGGVKRSADVIPIRKGAIVTAPITPDGGVSKPRPCVVLKTPAAGEQAILLVGITTDNESYDSSDTARYDPALFISMPYAKDGSVSTGFKVPCAAKATWVELFPRDKIRVTSRWLEDHFVDELIVKLKAYARAHP